MNVAVTFTEKDCGFTPVFTEKTGDVGGYDDGYESGYEEGKLECCREVLSSDATNVEMSAPLVLCVREYALNRFNGLTKIDLPNAEELMRAAFCDCVNLKEAYMPKLRVLGRESFIRCSGLTYLEFSCLESIGISGCNATNLVTFISRGEAIPNMIADSAFLNTPISSGTGYIYFPKALVDQAKAATNWSTYANQIRAIEDYPEITGG